MFVPCRATLAAALLAACAAASAASGLGQAPPAHVLFVVVDDLGFSDLGYKPAMYNLSGPGLRTPTIDALALSGVRLESYYVHALCSPSRTALLSGRYAYTNGMNAEVITNGQPDQMPTNLRTLADLLKLANWSTWAGGKYDMGMTSWGCTPTCRGFDHFNGFYNADELYFAHTAGSGIGSGLDFRADFAADASAAGVYSSDVFAARASAWIAQAVAGGAANSFAYLAFQAIHAPQQALQSDLDGYCSTAIPAEQPIRRIACAQMASVDRGLAAVIAAYKAAGIWEQTLVILTADNGGNTDTGGSNAPLRGAKATMYEGGMRAAAFVSGAGLAPAVRGSVSHELYSLVDWLPTIATGIAGVPLAEAAAPKHAYQPAPPPVDGVDIWQSLSTGAASPRTSALLYLDPFNCFAGVDVPCAVPGQAAIRSGAFKLISGHVGTYQGATGNVTTQFCGAHDGDLQPTLPPLNVTPATSPPFCPSGWVALDGGVRAPPEEAGAGGACASTPCRLPGASPLLAGGVFLYNVVDDMAEEHDLAAAMPGKVAELLAALQAINATNVPQSNSALDPAAAPSKHGGVWTPWRGSAVPADCDPNVSASTVKSNFDGVVWNSSGVIASGWAWSPQAADGGRAPLNVSFAIDGVPVGSVVAVVPRPGLVPKTGAPDDKHGFAWTLPPAAAAAINAPGKHVFSAAVAAPGGEEEPVINSPKCYSARSPVRCGAPD